MAEINKNRKQVAPERKEAPASQRKNAPKLSDRAQAESGSKRGADSVSKTHARTPLPQSSQLSAKKPVDANKKPTASTATKPATGSSTPAKNGGGRFGGALKSGNNSARNNSRRKQQATAGPVGPTQTPRKNNPSGSKKAQRIAAKQNESVAPKTERKEQPLPEILEYKVGMNVQDLSKILHRDTAEILKKLFLLGFVVNQNQGLETEIIELLAMDYGIEAKLTEEVDVADIDRFFDDENQEENQNNLQSRPPIVTIMGHVDHGKTTLLDYLRKTHVTDGEAGGITQHIGAYQATLNDQLITFLDTPGHAAFTEMRARGANVTDITVLVVAADDGIMPQTIEAIDHAKSANTPIIVAINKIDIPGVNPDAIINDLMTYELVPEQYGGDTIMVPLSAKTGEGVDKLLEMILLQAEMLNIKANPDEKARGTVIEARLDKGRGPVTTILVQNGSLSISDPIVVGNTFGRVRTMQNAQGGDLKIAGPATPIEITGLNEVPLAGDRFVVMNSEKEAREAGEERAQRALTEERNNNSVVTLDNLFTTMADKKMKSIGVIIKADVQGSVEALRGSLQKIEVDGVRVDIIRSGVGAISESDITLAKASDAIIVGFNVRPTVQAKSQSENDGVDIRTYNVIYNAIEEIEAAMKGQLDPEFVEKIVATVEVRDIFHFSKIGTIAGGMVTDGTITRDANVRLIRDGVVVYDGKIGSLKREKDDAREVSKGYELGLTIENFNDEKIGDVIEAYKLEEVPRN